MYTYIPSRLICLVARLHRWDGEFFTSIRILLIKVKISLAKILPFCAGNFSVRGTTAYEWTEKRKLRKTEKRINDTSAHADTSHTIYRSLRSLLYV